MIQLNFSKPVKIASLVIDSSSSKDQDKVGYQVLVSNDSFSWKEVFYEKILPPNRENQVKIYLNPNEVQFLKLNQIGSHQYAPWIINEIEVYEAD